MSRTSRDCPSQDHPVALNLRERFGPREPVTRRLLAQDFEFSPDKYPSLREFKLERDELGMSEKPLAVNRSYVLARGPEGLQLDLSLCLDGPDAAFELLFLRAGAFQRVPDSDRLVDVSAALQAGDAGVAWRWNERTSDGVLAFVRYNILVFMKGRFELLESFARELDADLSRLETRAEYGDSAAPVIEPVGTEGTLAAPAGTRFDLGKPPRPEAQHFFTASGGSVNRDASEPGRFYFRAGLQKGNFSIVAYRVGKGLLPDRQTIPVRIS